jgi:hypothetical protein
MDQSSQPVSDIRTVKNTSPVRRALVLLLFGCACFAFWGAVQPSSLNKIQRENRQPGTTAWQLTNPADNRQIEGYASLTSVPVGGDIDLFVNTQDATYRLTVFRTGWYGGKGGRKVLGPQTLSGVRQVTPATLPNATPVLECQWTNPFRIHVPTSWLSGIYLVKLHGNTSGKESYIIFTVRDSRRADLVFEQSVITYQAYNSWPEFSPLGGYGYSLYDNDQNSLQVRQASFSRPYGSCPSNDPNFTPPMFYNNQFGQYGIGAGDFLYHGAPAAMDFAIVRWLEHEGYDVTYITDVDTHEDVRRLLRAKGFLSSGHDEYWSEAMKSNVVQARDLGVSLGFFGGNYMYWPVELLPDSNGTPNRTISLAPKSGICGPPPPEMSCTMNSDCPTNLTCGVFGKCVAASQTQCTADTDCPTNLTCLQKQCTFTCMGKSEQTVVGGLWVNSVPTNGDIVIANDAVLSHWVFADTGLKTGDVIPGLIGVEYNGTDPNVGSPDGLQVLLHTQAPRFEDSLVMGNGGFPLPDNFNEDFNAWYDSFVTGGTADLTCEKNPIPPLLIVPPVGFCSNPWPATLAFGGRTDWTMTIYQADSGAWVFNAGTNQWSWGLDDYFTGLTTSDGANNGPAFRTQCGYPWFHPGLVSCRDARVEQITRNVLNKFVGRP